MSEVRLIDANALKYKNLAEVNGRLTYVLTAEEIDNAPTVDFEKLGESLNCQIRAEYGSCDDCLLSCPRNELIKLLDSARSQGKWIPVSERLPEDRNLVIVTAYWHETYQVMQASYFGEGEKNGWWCVPWNNCGDHMRNDLHVIAWQPLPEPYKENSTE